MLFCGISTVDWSEASRQFFQKCTIDFSDNFRFIYFMDEFWQCQGYGIFFILNVSCLVNRFFVFGFSEPTLFKLTALKSYIISNFIFLKSIFGFDRVSNHPIVNITYLVFLKNLLHLNPHHFILTLFPNQRFSNYI